MLPFIEAVHSAHGLAIKVIIKCLEFLFDFCAQRKKYKKNNSPHNYIGLAKLKKKKKSDRKF